MVKVTVIVTVTVTDPSTVPRYECVCQIVCLSVYVYGINLRRKNKSKSKHPSSLGRIPLGQPVSLGQYEGFQGVFQGCEPVQGKSKGAS